MREMQFFIIAGLGFWFLFCGGLDYLAEWLSFCYSISPIVLFFSPWWQLGKAFAVKVAFDFNAAHTLSSSLQFSPCHAHSKA